MLQSFKKVEVENVLKQKEKFYFTGDFKNLANFKRSLQYLP